MVPPRRGPAAALAAWLALAPAATAGLDEVLLAHARGEASDGELRAARRAHANAAVARGGTWARASRRDHERADRDPLTRIGDWLRDLPTRLGRRVAPRPDGLTRRDQIDALVRDSPVEAFAGNATQREAASDWTRPLKVTARLEAGKIQGVIERMIAFGGVRALHQALAGKPEVLARAGDVVARLTDGERTRLVARLASGSLGARIGGLVGGKPGSALGRLVKDRFGNNILLAVAAAGLVGILFDDALDLDTLKDHLVALDTVASVRTREEQLLMRPLEAVAYYHMQRGAAGAFEKLWGSLTAGGGGLARALGKADGALRGLGARLARPVPAHLAGKAAAAGRQAASLGLPGVSGATGLSLPGVAGALFRAGTLGMLGMPALASLWKLVAGLEDGVTLAGNRGKVLARTDLATTYYQRTGDALGDGLRERRVALDNLWGGYRKFPWTNALDWVLRFVGGYTGAVVAAALFPPLGLAGLLGTLVVSAIFSEGGVALGRWLGARLDTSEEAYARKRAAAMAEALPRVDAWGFDAPGRRRARAALAAVDRARAALGIRTRADLDRLRREEHPGLAALDRLAAAYLPRREAALEEAAAVAFARARDVEKLLRVAQVEGRVRLVRDLASIRRVQRDGLVYLEVDGWRAEASPRYDFVTLEGRRGVWDPGTGRIRDVGRVREQNGKRVAFLPEGGVRVEAGVLRPRTPVGGEERAGDVHVTSNGIVFEKDPGGEWVVRGYGGEYDLVLRESGRRFAWDGEVFREVRPAPLEAPPEAQRRAAGAQARTWFRRRLRLASDPTRQALADLGRAYARGAPPGS